LISDRYVQSLRFPNASFVEFILQENYQKHFLVVTTPVYTPAQNVCTTGAIPELGQTVQPHLPFSPYLLPSVLHLFGALKDTIA
jgi:hypothetical protein